MCVKPKWNARCVILFTTPRVTLIAGEACVGDQAQVLQAAPTGCSALGDAYDLVVRHAAEPLG